jgi:hypothetical protein
MSKLKISSTDIVIIPAQPGWFAATALENAKTLDKDAVIAWEIEYDHDKEALVVWPITFNVGRNMGFGITRGYVLCDPYGNFIPAYDQEDPILKTEEEAVRYCLRELDVKIDDVKVGPDGQIRRRKERRPKLEVIKSPEPEK